MTPYCLCEQPTITTKLFRWETGAPLKWCGYMVKKTNHFEQMCPFEMSGG